MYVKRTVRRRGEKEYIYLSLVEAVRVDGKNRQRELFRLGEVSELEQSGQLDRVIAALTKYASGEWMDARSVEGAGAPSFGSVASIAAIFDQCGLREHFDAIGETRGSDHLADTVLAMVANRLCDPASKRRTVLEWFETIEFPDGIEVPSLAQCYRALDALAAVKEETEAALYRRLTDLTNLDLRLALYDLTSTYFETEGTNEDFPSLAYGYSRDKRSDRPQIVIGLLVTGNGIPIAHYVFAGNTRDSTTLKSVMADYQARFGIGKIALVADRGLISEQNVTDLGEAGFDHVLATRLHGSDTVETVLEKAVDASSTWVSVDDRTTATDVTHDGVRYVVVSSSTRKARDDRRREELLSRTEDKLIALADRVSAKRLVDRAEIGAASDRILRDSGVGRCFTTSIREGSFSWSHDEDAVRFEERLLAGRYVLTTSLPAKTADAATVVRHYKMLQNVERRFRVMKDFLALRPVYHRTENRVRGHIALCVIAATIEAVMGERLKERKVMDPEKTGQVMTPRLALHHLSQLRRHRLRAGREIDVIDRPTTIQRQILDAFGVDTTGWNRATVA
jgi:transposase